MSMAYFVVIKRRCWVAGQTVEVGATVEVPAATAAGLLGCGHELADASDTDALLAELRADFEAQAVAVPFFGQSLEGAQQQARDFEASMRPKRRIGFLD